MTTTIKDGMVWLSNIAYFLSRFIGESNQNQLQPVDGKGA